MDRRVARQVSFLRRHFGLRCGRHRPALRDGVALGLRSPLAADTANRCPPPLPLWPHTPDTASTCTCMCALCALMRNCAPHRRVQRPQHTHAAHVHCPSMPNFTVCHSGCLLALHVCRPAGGTSWLRLGAVGRSPVSSVAGPSAVGNELRHWCTVCGGELHAMRARSVAAALQKAQ